MPLSVIDNAGYETYSDKLSDGEIILLYTDGLLEAKDNGEMFGEEGIARALLDCGGLDISEVPAKLLDGAREFAHGNLADDVAIIALSLDKGRKKRADTKPSNVEYINDWVI